MRKTKISSLIFLCAIYFFSAVVFAQTADNSKLPWGQELPTGMEVIQMGGSANLVVPKGAKTRKVGAQIIVEGTKEYMSRRFFETDEHLTKIDKALEDLNKEIASLKDVLSKLSEKIEAQNKAVSQGTPGILIKQGSEATKEVAAETVVPNGIDETPTLAAPMEPQKTVTPPVAPAQTPLENTNAVMLGK